MSQLRLAEVSPTLLHKVRATPRYDALIELKKHWAIDLLAGKHVLELSPPEHILVPAARSFRCGDLDVRVPFPQVSPHLPRAKFLSWRFELSAPRCFWSHFLALPFTHPVF